MKKKNFVNIVTSLVTVLFKKTLCSRRATRNFSGQVRFVKLGHFDKHFIKKSRKKALQGKILKFFLLDTLRITF